MFASERQEMICSMLQKKGAVTVSELTEYFSVSIETARRDLLALEEKNLLHRVHGGAISVGRMSANHNYTERLNENKKQKQELCRYAAELIKDGDIIAIDSGTTAIELAEFIAADTKNITVLTHDPNVFQVLSKNESIKIIMIGGHFSRKEFVFCGPIAVSSFKSMHVSKAFLFPSAVSLKFGAASFYEDLFAVQQAILEIADKIIICADSNKFEKNALLKLCDLNPNHIYVTDSDLPNEIYNLYKENNISIVKGN